MRAIADDRPPPKFETPWTIRQTETHLVFGPLSRHFPFAYILVPAAAAGLYFLWRSKQVDFLLVAVFAIVIGYIFRFNTRQQAIFGCIITKVIFGLLAVMAVIIIFPMTLSQHQPEAWSILLLGLIWFPLLGAFPKITPYQRYFTLARIALSVPALIWFSKTATFT